MWGEVRGWGGGWSWGSRGGRGCGLQGRVEEIMIVGFAAKGLAEGDGKWGHIDAEEALVGPVGGATGPEGGWAKVKKLAMEGFC